MKMRKEILIVMFALLCGAIYVDVSITKSTKEKIAAEKAETAETARVKAENAKKVAAEKKAEQEEAAKQKAEDDAKKAEEEKAKAEELANNDTIDNDDEAIDKVLSDVTAGGGFGPRENYDFKVDDLDDGFMVHVYPKDDKEEMGKFKVFTNGDVIAGYVTSTDEAIKATKDYISSEDKSQVNTDTSIYSYTAGEGDQLGQYVVNVKLKDDSDQDKLDYNAVGTYKVDSQGIMYEFKQDTSNSPANSDSSMEDTFKDEACTNAVNELKDQFNNPTNDDIGYAAFLQDDGSYIIKQSSMSTIKGGGSGTMGWYSVSKDGKAKLLDSVGEITGKQCYAGK